MLEPPAGSEPGWYRTPDDPPDTHRYWDGASWVGDAEAIPNEGVRRPPGIDEPLASPGSRIVAQLIDTVVRVIVVVLIMGLVDNGFRNGNPSRLASLLGLVVLGGYEILAVNQFGATFGKHTMGLRVISISGQSPPDLTTATRRWVPTLVTALPVIGGPCGLALLFVSLAWVTSDPNRRSAFDRFGGTFVIAPDSLQRIKQR